MEAYCFTNMNKYTTVMFRHKDVQAGSNFLKICNNTGM